MKCPNCGNEMRPENILAWSYAGLPKSRTAEILSQRGNVRGYKCYHCRSSSEYITFSFMIFDSDKAVFEYKDGRWQLIPDSIRERVVFT